MTVSVNATSVRSIVPRTTATIKTTITQYETASSVCRIKETLAITYPEIPIAPPPQKPVVPPNGFSEGNPPIDSQSPNSDNKRQDNKDKDEVTDKDEDYPGA